MADFEPLLLALARDYPDWFTDEQKGALAQARYFVRGGEPDAVEKLLGSRDDIREGVAAALDIRAIERQVGKAYVELARLVGPIEPGVGPGVHTRWPAYPLTLQSALLRFAETEVPFVWNELLPGEIEASAEIWYFYRTLSASFGESTREKIAAMSGEELEAAFESYRSEAAAIKALSGMADDAVFSLESRDLFNQVEKIMRLEKQIVSRWTGFVHLCLRGREFGSREKVLQLLRHVALTGEFDKVSMIDGFLKENPGLSRLLQQTLAEYSGPLTKTEMKMRSELKRRIGGNRGIAVDLVRYLHGRTEPVEDLEVDWLLGLPAGAGDKQSVWLPVMSRHGKEQFAYGATPYGLLRSALARLNPGPDDIFYDLGSGLGQTVLYVSIAGGIRARGIELVPSRLAVGNEALKKLGLRNAAFIQGNVLDADFSDGTIFYLYYPFSSATRTPVFEKLKEIAADHPIRIVALWPVDDPFFETQTDWLKEIHRESDGRLSRFRLVVFDAGTYFVEEAEKRIWEIKRAIDCTREEIYEQLKSVEEITPELWTSVTAPLGNFLRDGAERMTGIDAILNRVRPPGWEDVGRLRHDINNVIMVIGAHIELAGYDLVEGKSLDLSWLPPPQDLGSLLKTVRHFEQSKDGRAKPTVEIGVSDQLENLRLKNLDHMEDLSRIIDNLASNGVKYINLALPAEERFMKVQAEVVGDRLAVVFEDNGRGMSREFVEKHYGQMGMRAPEVLETSIPGHGYGASSVKKLAESLGGTVEVESELGVGTTVRVALPLSLFEGVSPKIGADPAPDGRGLLEEDNGVRGEVVGAEVAPVEGAEPGRGVEVSGLMVGAGLPGLMARTRISPTAGSQAVRVAVLKG